MSRPLLEGELLAPYIPGVLQDLFGVGAAVQGGAQIAGSILQSNAINNATDAQERTAKNSLDFEKQQYGDTQTKQAPFYNAGTQALGGLQTGLNLGGSTVAPGQLLQGYGQTYSNPNFTSTVAPAQGVQMNGFIYNPQSFDPSQVNINADPGYQFGLNQGLQALQRSQAATGISGGAAAKGIADYTVGKAQQHYDTAYQQALAANQQNNNLSMSAINQNAAIQNQNFAQQLQGYNANTANNQFGYTTNYNVANTDQANQFNRLATLAGYGQVASNQLQQAGQTTSANMANINAQLGNAQSAGSVAQGQTWGGLASGLGNTFGQYAAYRQAQQLGGYGAPVGNAIPSTYTQWGDD